MDNQIEQRLQAQEEKIDAILASVTKTEKYFKTTLWVTVIMFVLPIIGLIFIVPSFIASYTTSLEGLL
jgi:cell division protein FtsL